MNAKFALHLRYPDLWVFLLFSFTIHIVLYTKQMGARARSDFHLTEMTDDEVMAQGRRIAARAPLSIDLLPPPGMQ